MSSRSVSPATGQIHNGSSGDSSVAQTRNVRPQKSPSNRSVSNEPNIEGPLEWTGESFWEPDFFQYLLGDPLQDPSTFLTPMTDLEPKTLLPANIDLPTTSELESIERFFDLSKNTHYIPFIHKRLFMNEFIEGRASNVLVYAIQAFSAVDVQEALLLVEKARNGIEENVRKLNDLYRTTQALILIVILQCILLVAGIKLISSNWMFITSFPKSGYISPLRRSCSTVYRPRSKPRSWTPILFQFVIEISYFFSKIVSRTRGTEANVLVLSCLLFDFLQSRPLDAAHSSGLPNNGILSHR